MRTRVLGAASVQTCAIDRRFPRLVSFALAAAHLAIEDARGLPDGRGSIVVATAHGGAAFASEFHEAFSSPLLFSASVHNAAASVLSERLGVHGPVHTLLAGPTATADAIAVAAGILQEALADWALAVATDELTEAVLRGYATLGCEGSPAEGAAAFLLARTGRTLERLPRGRVRLDGSEVNMPPGEAFSATEGFLLAAAWKARTAEVLCGNEWLPVFAPWSEER